MLCYFRIALSSSEVIIRDNLIFHFLLKEVHGLFSSLDLGHSEAIGR